MNIKKPFLNVSLVALLALSVAPGALAHDALDGSDMSKGQRSVFSNEQMMNLSDPSISGSKNLSFLNEAAAAQLKEINGVQ
ncbi:MAG TPA: hypothetical protein VLQ20_12250, partial [Planococcus sp. (in: firmicutes)]|nr:hypothetical protein [Planococcus sp. (in: firmicutes)]